MGKAHGLFIVKRLAKRVEKSVHIERAATFCCMKVEYVCQNENILLLVCLTFWAKNAEEVEIVYLVTLEVRKSMKVYYFKNDENIVWSIC